MKTIAFVLAGFVSLLASSAMAAEHGHAHHAPDGVQTIDFYSQGNTIHMLFTEFKNHQPLINYQRLRPNGKWSKPVRVDEGLSAAHGPHRGHDPAIAASGKQLVALWMMKGSGFHDSGPLVCARSEDGGKTWQGGATPADDGSNAGHAFFDIAADGEGRFHCVWLDSRDGAQGLRYSSSTDGGKTWAKNITLKANTCECCWNSMIVHQGKVHVMFRDKDPRDMSMVSFEAGKPVAPKPAVVGDFRWDIDGCPHIGGGLASARSGQLHAVVYTGNLGKVGVHHVSSVDGLQWGLPRKISGYDAHKSDVGTLGKDKVVVAWDESAEGFSEAKYRWSANGGLTWSAPVTLSQPGIEASYPRVVSTKDDLWIFWTESQHGWPGKWKSHKVTFDEVGDSGE